MYFYMHKLSLLSKSLPQDSSVCSEPNHFIYFHDYEPSIQLVLEDVCWGLQQRGSQGTKKGKCTFIVVVDTGNLTFANAVRVSKSDPNAKEMTFSPKSKKSG